MKLVIVGDSGVGKTKLAVRFKHDRFDSTTQSTVGAGFFKKEVELEGASIDLEIWDTAGQEKFYSLAQMYYNGAKAVILVFDVSQIDECYEKTKAWVDRVAENVNDDIPVLLVAAKSDLYKGDDLDSKVHDLFEALNSDGGSFFGYAITSAINGTNVEAPFVMSAKEVLRRKKVFEAASANGRSVGLFDGDDPVYLDAEGGSPKKRCC